MTSLDTQKTQANTPQENEVEKYMDKVRQDILEVINTIETNKIKIIKNKNNSGLKDRLKQENKKVLSKDSSLHSNFKSLLQAFLQNSKYLKLFPEFSWEEWENKLNKKFNRYFPIYKDFLIEKVKQNPWNEENIILDFVKTLFIFEENLEKDKFEKFFMNNDSEKIDSFFQKSKNIFSSFAKIEYDDLENSEHTETFFVNPKLTKFLKVFKKKIKNILPKETKDKIAENKTYKKIKWQFSKKINFDNKDIINLSKKNQDQWLMMIKNFIADSVDENWEINEQIVKNSIHTHYEKTTERFIETFDHWYKSTNLDSDFLFVLKNFHNNLEKDFNILKNSWYWNWCKKDLYWYFSDKLDWKKYSPEFLISINKLLKANSNNSSSNIEEIIETVKENRTKYLKSHIREYKSLKWVDLEKVDLDTWHKWTWFERRSEFFEKAFVKYNKWKITLTPRYLKFLWIPPDESWNINIDNLLSWWDQKTKFEEYLKNNFDKQKKSLRWKEEKEKWWFYVEDTIEQFKDILKYFQNKNFENKENEVLKFIEQEKNSVDLLVWFWWENLENGEKEKIIVTDRDKIIKEKYPSHWIKEWIITILNNKWLLKDDWAQIFMAKEWEEPTNSSYWNKTAVLERLFHWYKEWNINLSDFQINDKKMKDITDLYIPAKISKDSIISTSDINNFIELWLDTCSSLLDWKKYKNNSYLKIMTENWFDTKDTKKIYELKEFLKYLKYLIPSLKSMLEDGKRDRNELNRIKETLEAKNHILWKRFIVWPDKDTDRWFVKMVSKYNWDPREMWDLTRWMVTSENIVSITDDISEFIKIIKYDQSVEQINISESTWNFTEKAPKPSWYRDVVLEVKMKSWNKVEIQFHYKEYLEFKKHWYVLWEDFMKESFVNNQKKFVKFTDKEIDKILNEAERNYKWIKLPENFAILCENPNHFNDKVNWEKIHKSWNLEDNWSFISDNKLSSDSLYNLARAMESDKSEEWETLVSKLRKVESIWYDLAWWRTLANELRQSWEKAKSS